MRDKPLFIIKAVFLTQHSLPKASQLKVGILKGIFHLLIQWLLFAVKKNGAAPIQDPLWSTLHHQQVTGF